MVVDASRSVSTRGRHVTASSAPPTPVLPPAPAPAADSRSQDSGSGPESGAPSVSRPGLHPSSNLAPREASTALGGAPSTGPPPPPLARPDSEEQAGPPCPSTARSSAPRPVQPSSGPRPGARPAADVDEAEVACRHAGFRTPEDLWLLYRLGVEGGYPEKPLFPSQARKFCEVLNRVAGQAAERDSFVGHMLIFLLPKLGLMPYLLTKDRDAAWRRFRAYPGPQLEDLLARAGGLGGPEGLRQRYTRQATALTGVPGANPPGGNPATGGLPGSDAAALEECPVEEDEILGPGRDALSLSRMRSRVRTIHHGVQRGLLHQSARLVLHPDEAAVAANPAVVERLRALHPEGEPGLVAFPAAGRTPVPETDAEALRAAAHSMKPGTSPGLSGWTVSLIRTALCADGMVTYLLRQLTAMKRNEAGGWRLYCASRLTALSKPSGGVRPIAVGEVPYRLLMRTVLCTYGERVRTGLLPTQYGVGTPGGTEPVIRAVEHVYQGELQEYQQVTALDFSNAYNTLRRRSIGEAMRRWYGPLYRLTRWAYGQAAPLVVAGPREGNREERATVELFSSEGVRQGDPLAPLLFSAGIRPYLEELQGALGPEHLVLAYLDDVFILSKAEGDVVQVAERVAAESGNGLRLNVAKSHVYTREQLAAEGMPILGTVVGGEGARRAHAEKIAAELASGVERLLQLTELPRQDVLLLLVQCIQQKHRHLQRQLDGTGLAWFWDAMDQTLQRGILRLRGDPEDAEVDALSRELITLPDRLGGLGVASYAECQGPARATMQETADEVLRLSGVLPLYPARPSRGTRTGDAGRAQAHPDRPPSGDGQASTEGPTGDIHERPGGTREPELPRGQQGTRGWSPDRRPSTEGPTGDIHEQPGGAHESDQAREPPGTPAETPGQRPSADGQAPTAEPTGNRQELPGGTHESDMPREQQWAPAEDPAQLPSTEGLTGAIHEEPGGTQEAEPPREQQGSPERDPGQGTSALGPTDDIHERAGGMRGADEPRERARIQSQRARCNALFEARHARLLDQVPTDVGVAILEHGEELGRRYLRTIPFQPSLELEDRVVIGALRQRTFQMGGLPEGRRNLAPTVCVPHGRCEKCGAHDVSAVHGDACRAVDHRRVIRLHDAVTGLLGRYLKAIPGARVTQEAVLPVGERRLDLCARGWAAPNGTAAGYDVTVVSGRRGPAEESETHSDVHSALDSGARRALAAERSAGAGGAVAPRQVAGDAAGTGDGLARARHVLETRLDAREHHKRVRYRDVAGFAPLVLSMGGAMGRTFERHWASWKERTSGMSMLARQLSVLLIRERITRYTF